MLFLTDARRPEMDFLPTCAVVLPNVSGQSSLYGIKKLSNTNWVVSRHIKRKEASFSVELAENAFAYTRTTTTTRFSQY